MMSLTFAAGASVFTNTPDADAFVWAAAPGSNYGGAGALSVSGATASNGSGVTNGVFDTFIRFNTGAMVTNFNLAFGSNNWVISGATLQLTENGAPTQTIFNRGVGAFQIRWIANDNWTEGTGMPNAPATTGISYSEEPSLLNSLTDLSLGVFTNAGANATEHFPLALPPAFVANLQAGGEVGFYLTAVNPGTGFTFNSRHFGTTSAWPYLSIAAAPQPGLTSASLAGTNVVLTASNGAAGGTYYVLTSTNLASPISQWTAVLTNVLAAGGNFVLTITNAASTNIEQFFMLRTQ